MLCPKCGKESNNLRVCAHCQTPYPVDPPRGSTPRYTGAVPRTTGSISAVGAAGDPRIAMARRSSASKIKRWSIIGVLAVFTVGYYFYTRDRVIPVGVALPNLIDHPMLPGEATATISTVNAKAIVEMRGNELTVRIAAERFPERRDGQLALAQQYARADEIVQRRKRLISFLDPSGVPFARADPEKGVTMTR
jgi:hypothetical protein